MPTRDEIRQHALRRLRRLNAATRFLARPGLLAERVNLKLAKEGWLDRILAARFATGGASSGSPWPALKPSTVKQRARLGFAGTGPILVRSGTLQDAALEGKTEADAFGLTKKLKDRAAPRYVGGGEARKRKTNRAAKEANDFFGIRIGNTGRVSDYAEALNRERPFFAKPSERELQPLLERRRRLLAALLSAVRNGESITAVLN